VIITNRPVTFPLKKVNDQSIFEVLWNFALCPHVFKHFDLSGSESVPSTLGTKQGCVLAPLLFITFFFMMLLLAFKGRKAGIPIRYCTGPLSST